MEHRHVLEFGLPETFTKKQFLQTIRMLRSLPDVSEHIQDETLDVMTASPKSDAYTKLSIVSLPAISKYCLSECVDEAMIQSGVAKWSRVSLDAMEPLDMGFDVSAMYRVESSTDMGAEGGVAYDSWVRTRKSYALSKAYKYAYKQDDGHDNGVPIHYCIVAERTNGDEMVYHMQETNLSTSAREVYRAFIEARVDADADADAEGPEQLFGGILQRHAVRFIRILMDDPYMLTRDQKESVRQAYGKLIRPVRNIPKNMVAAEDGSDDSARFFLAPKPMSLERVQLTPPEEALSVTSVLAHYTVTEKADGERMLMYVDGEGNVFLIDNSMDVKFTGCRLTNLGLKEWANSLIDGELVPNDVRIFQDNPHADTSRHLFAAFDLYFKNGKKLLHEPLVSYDQTASKKGRYDILRGAFKHGQWDFRASLMECTVKQHRLAKNAKEMFGHCNDILDEEGNGELLYKTDGLIFTPAKLPVLGYYANQFIKINRTMRWGKVFKWKPPHLNTIDFLVRIPRGARGLQARLDSAKKYQEFHLLTGFNVNRMRTLSVKDGMEILYDPQRRQDHEANKSLYIAKEFIPTKYYMDDVFKAFIEADDKGLPRTEEGGEVIEDDMIVEFAFDMENVGEKYKYRWRPLRVRYDKTKVYKQNYADPNRRMSGTANDFETANSIWISIHEPVTEDYIRNFTPLEDSMKLPYLKEIGGDDGNDDNAANNAANVEDTYYVREIPRQHLLSSTMLNFHNQIIKNMLFDLPNRGHRGRIGKTLLELACGRAGDMQRWRDHRYSFILGIDVSRDNVMNATEGCYGRVINTLSNPRNKASMPHMAFIIGDCAKRIMDGSVVSSHGGQDPEEEAGLQKESVDLLRYLYGDRGRTLYDRLLNPYQLRGVAAYGFDVVSCQFAIHYFFENEERLSGFLDNVVENMKPDGAFIATFMDGAKVHEKLVAERGQVVRKYDNDNVIWAMVKRYASFESGRDALGKKIDVYLENINQMIPEYLVDFEYLKQVAAAKGLVVEASQLFEETHQARLQEVLGHQQRYRGGGSSARLILDMNAPNNNIQRELSYMNRWVIFRKQHVDEAV
jgi:hypothetical protein